MKLKCRNNSYWQKQKRIPGRTLDGISWKGTSLQCSYPWLRGPDLKLDNPCSVHALDEVFNFQTLCSHTCRMEIIIIGIIPHLQKWDNEESKHTRKVQHSAWHLVNIQYIRVFPLLLLMLVLLLMLPYLGYLCHSQTFLLPYVYTLKRNLELEGLVTCRVTRMTLYH